MLWLLLAASLSAHVVEQMYAEVRPGGLGLVVLFDVGYAKPEWRGDPDAPQPTREWLVDLPEEAWRELREETRRYLGECLEFSGPDGSVAMSWGFPDFDASPPDFPKLLTGGAYMRVVVSPAEPVDGLRCSVAPGERPDFVLKVPADGEPRYVTLDPGDSFVLIEDAGMTAGPTRGGLSHAFWQGFLHVVPEGWDHVLFVLGLFLLARKWRPLVWQSLLFTAAHTVTLGLTAAGVIVPPEGWIEPLIALSIAVIAVENLWVRSLGKWRVLLVFGFGLVHGMGFATALASTLRMGEGFGGRLLATNAGVEAAQVTVLAAAWLATVGWSEGAKYEIFRKVANVALAAVALWWFVGRVWS